MSELKPCPFCNAKPKQHNPLYLHVRHEEGCALAVDGERNEVYTIEAWNTRFERTCRNLRSGSDFKCSECGCEVVGSDYFMEANMNNGDWNYCPNCRAKVVES